MRMLSAAEGRWGVANARVSPPEMDGIGRLGAVSGRNASILIAAYALLARASGEFFSKNRKRSIWPSQFFFQSNPVKTAAWVCLST